MHSKVSAWHLPATTLAAAAILIVSAMNGHGAAVSSSDIYPAVVQGDGALGYYRFGDSLARGNTNYNRGSLGAAGNLTNTAYVHAFPGAIVGDPDYAQFFSTVDGSTTAAPSWGMIPYNGALNPDNTQAFTVEAWLYPVSDQINAGQCPVNNRVAGNAANRTGWVIFQRAPDSTYAGKSGYEGIGWDFRMYNYFNGSSGALEVTNNTPYAIGQWMHVVFVYQPRNLSNATLTAYFNGVPTATNVWNGGSTGTQPGYVANDPTNDAALSLGTYNNASGVPPSADSYSGGIDEFAWYPTNLTAAQILAHYQNGTNANRAVPYPTLIQSANPTVYLRLGELSPGLDTMINLGDLRGAGFGTNTPPVKHPGSSPLVGRSSGGSHSGHYRDISSTGNAFASIPWTQENNPDAGVPFTLEAWFRPTGDQMNPGPAPINNRVANGIADRTGWVIYQRDPNSSYQGPPAVPGESGIGWTFRMYSGAGSSGQDVLTGQPYTMGQWQHFVITWDPQTDLGPSASGSEAWSGIQTAYIDGEAVATNSSAVYAANTNPTEDPANHPPADFCVGSYNLASGLGEEFEGDVAEVAFYNGYLLRPDQILAHYMAGTNAHPATNYETLVLTAAYDGQPSTPQRTMPQTYLRLNEPPYLPAANSGSLGFAANGSLVMTANEISGPSGLGFASPNPAVPLDGATSWVSLNDPAGLSFSGEITLEAWINPAAAQNDPAYIIAHGPPSPTVYDINTNDASFYPILSSGTQLSSNEVFLCIQDNSANYAIGTSDGTKFHGATAAIPTGDLGGTNGWVYLAGTYDGTNWNLYRNGAQIASVADKVGALPVTGAEWAIGATGMGWADFFAGGIDEVAIYGTALSPATVKAHYYVAQQGAVTLSISAPKEVVTLDWPAGTLQQATSPEGPYTDVPGTIAGTPYQPATSASAMFYRVRL